MQPTGGSRPDPRLLSIAHLTVLDAAPPELVSAAADAGFDAVGIRVWPAADEPAYPMLGDTPMMGETIARLADTGTYVLDVEVLRLRPDSQLDDALRILDAGARLRARGVLVICNDPEEDRLVESFAAVCEAAGARGLRACLEFMIFSSVKTIADAQRVLNLAGHPAGAILVDALHLQRSGGTPADVGAVAPERLPYVQLCDGPFQPILPDSAVALTEARTGRLYPAMVNCRWLSLSTRCRPGRRWPSRRRSPTWPERRSASGPGWPTRPSPGCWPRRTGLTIRPMRDSETRPADLASWLPSALTCYRLMPGRGTGRWPTTRPGILASGRDLEMGK
jgi:sugar phosphate isomerase/epimerase